MKTMILSVMLLTVVSLSTKAQILRVGYNAANISVNNNGDVDENKVLSSFQVGVMGDVKIMPFLYLQPGILFTGKGSKTQSGNVTDPTYYRATTNPMYVEIPVNLVFKTPGPLRFFVGAGPYLGIGVSGKNKVEGKFFGTSFASEEKIEWSNDDPATLDYEEGAGYGIMKRFDYGLNAVAGIEVSKVVLALGYGHGLAKLQSGSNSGADENNKHRVLSFTLGVKL